MASAAATAEHRAQHLSGLASPQLRAKATDAGVDAEKLAALKDTEFDVNAAMISLILRRLEDPAAPLPFTGQRVLAHDSGSRTAALTRWSEAVKAGGMSTLEVCFWVLLRLAWHIGPPCLFINTSMGLAQCVADAGPGASATDDGSGSAGAVDRRAVSMADTPFAWIVCLWWSITVALVLVCIYANPSFLLVDLRASFRDGYFTCVCCVCFPSAARTAHEVTGRVDCRSVGRQDATGGYFFW
jgi:hypothetical protein